MYFRVDNNTKCIFDRFVFSSDNTKLYLLVYDKTKVYFRVYSNTKLYFRVNDNTKVYFRVNDNTIVYLGAVLKKHIKNVILVYFKVLISQIKVTRFDPLHVSLN